MLLDEGMTVAEKVLEQTGVIGEKIEISAQVVEDTQVSSYVHAGNRLATIVGFNQTLDHQVARDIAMQVAAMSPIYIYPEDEGAESTSPEEILISQSFIKDPSLTIEDMVKSIFLV